MAISTATNHQPILPILDRQHLRQQWSGLDRATRKQVMQIFMAELATRKSAIETASKDAQGLAEIAEQAHGIKGSANNIGACHLGEWARRTEQHCLAMAADAVDQQLKQLPPIYSRTLKEVRSYINHISQQENS